MAVGTYVLNANTSVPASFSSYSGSHSYNTSPNPRVITVDLAGANESINCYEISNEKNTAASNTVGGSLLNRLYPANTTITSYQETTITSAGHRLRSDVTLSNLVTGSSLKTDYDYFVVLYADDAMLHHVAKITSVVTYDVVGDGIEFTPALKSDIPKGTKFTIYRGPSAAQTDIVAVGYGLMGDTVDSASTVNATDRRHDNYVEVSRPTFYFYEDRISDSKGGKQLDYLTKYNLVKSRYYASSPETTVSIFTTEADFGNFIQDKSRYRFQASIVDNLRTADQTITGTANEGVNYDGATTGATYTYDRTDWDDAHRNASRTVYTLASSPAVSTHHGPSRYIKYITSPEKTRVMLNLLSTGVYSSVTKSGNYAEVSLVDTNRMTRLKINPNEDMKVREMIFDESIKGNPLMKLPGIAEARTSTTVLYFTGLTDGQDLRLLLGTGPFDIIRLEDYYFALSAISAPADGEQNITISHRRLINNKVWSTGMLAGLLTDLTSKSTNVYRKAWSNVVDNMMCDFDIDTQYDGTTLTKMKIDITSTPERSDINGLNYIIQDRECSGLRFTVNLGDKNNGFIKFSDNTEDLYQLGSLNFFDYINGEAYVDKITFDGWIEFIENNNEYGIYTYTLKGRDDINKLLGAHVNKKYLYSSEYVYSTLSPVSDIVYSGYTTYGGLNSSGFGDRYSAGVGRSLDWINDGAVSEANKNLFVEGSRLYVKDSHSSNYLYLGTVYSGAVPHATSGNCKLIDRVEVEDSALTVGNYALEYVGSAPLIKIYVAKESVIAGKSLETNILHDSTPTTLKGSADKGINYLSGKEITIKNGVMGTTLIGSKAINTDESLGFPISNIKEIDSDKDSPISFQVMDGTEANILSKHTVSSMSEYEIVSVDNVDGNNRLSIAPIMPIVLGRVDANSGDTRLTSGEGIYLLNTNGLPTGGFLHHVNSETSSNITQNGNLPIRLCGRFNDAGAVLSTTYESLYNVRWGTPIWRYIDLQKKVPGSLTFDDNIADRITNTSFATFGKVAPLSIYKENKGAVQGYALANKVGHDGTIFSTSLDNEYTNSYQKEGSPETRGILPALGSLFDDITIAPTHYYNSIYNTGIREAKTSGSFTHTEKEKLQFEAFDPKCLNWHLFSVGDIQPDSMGRMNHIGYKAYGVDTTARNFADYSIILKYDGIKTKPTNTHQKYKGNMDSFKKVDNHYETHPITSSSIAPDKMKRFGMVRLIEATFDWHFNNVDVENLGNKKYKLDSSIENFNLESRVLEADAAINTNYLHSSAISTTSPTSTGSSNISVNSVGKLGVKITGTADGTSAGNILEDSGGASAHFTSANVGQMITNITTNEHTFVLGRTSNTILTTTSTAVNGLRRGWKVGDTFSIMQYVDVYTSPYTDSTGKARKIGKVVSSSGTTITLSSNADVAYSGELFFAYHDDNLYDYPYKILMKDFNKHLITGRRLNNYAMLGQNKNDFTYLSIERLVSPPYFDKDVATAGSLVHPFRHHGSTSFNRIMGHSRVIQDLAEYHESKLNDDNKLRTGMLGIITKGLDAWTFKGSTTKDIEAINPDTVYNTNYINWQASSVYGVNQTSDRFQPPVNANGLEIEIKNAAVATEDNTKAGILKTNSAIIFTHPADESARQIRLLTTALSTGLFQTDRVQGNEMLAGFTSSANNYQNGRLLVSEQVDYKLARSGMVMPISGYSRIRGDIYTDTGLSSTIAVSCSANDATCNVGDSRLLRVGMSISNSNDTITGTSGLDGKAISHIVSATSVELTSVFSAGGTDSAGTQFIGTATFTYPDEFVESGPSYPITAYNFHTTNTFDEYEVLNSDKLVPNIGNPRGGILSKEIASGDFIGGEPNSYLGYDPEQLHGTKTNLTHSRVTGAEMFYKCVLDLTAGGSGDAIYSPVINTINGQSRRIIIITVNDRDDNNTITIKNRWINYVPNLTGYYLASEDGIYSLNAASVSNRNINNSIPNKIHQIVSHWVDKTGDASNPSEVTHYLEIDNATATPSNVYRLMRVAENCFYDFTPNEIDLFKLSKEYTKKPRDNECYTDVDKFNSYTDSDVYYNDDSIYNEAVLSMYLPVEVDGRASLFVVNRTPTRLFHATGSGLSHNLDLFIHDTEYDMLITDGYNKMTSTMRVDYTSSNPRVKLTFSNMTKIHGLASLGEIFQIDIFSNKKIETNRLSIGTSFNVVNEVEDIVNEVLETNNIVYTKSADTNRYYEAFDLQKIDLYSACNYVGSFKGRKLIVDGSSIKFKTDIETYDYTGITISDKGDDHDLQEIKTDVSLFDFYNQVTVYGDEGIIGFSRDSAHQRENDIKELVEVDLTIQTKDAADKRANQLIKLHSESSIGIEFKMGNRNAKYIKPGNMIKLDLLSTDPDPLNDIIGEYMVLAVEYHLTETIKVTLGKYNMGLSERIAEIMSKGDKINSAIVGRNFRSTGINEYNFDNLKIRELKIKITRTANTVGLPNTLSFGRLLGFGTELGFKVVGRTAVIDLEEDLT